MHQQQVILQLSLIEGVGPSAIKQILEKKPQNFDLKNLAACTVSDVQNIFYLSQQLSEKIVKGLQDTKLLEQELNLIEKNKIKWTTFLDEDYPYLLKNIHLPPPILYWQGSLSDNQKRIAFVGARKAGNYCNKIVQILLPELIENNWEIVSGGAVGADAIAHKMTLDLNGKTIAVLGSGLLKPYPNVNIKLFKEIVEKGGAVVSAFPLNFEAIAGNFPARNRIISGLSRGCVVMQAAAKSGAKITASFALEQGREVFAVPGPIYDELSIGCHELIQQGAKLVMNANDILSEFGESVDNARILRQAQDERINNFEDMIQERTLSSLSFLENSEINNFEKKESIEDYKKINKNHARPEPVEGYECDPIITLCSSPISTQELLDKTNLDLQALQAKLFDLQLEGKINQNFAGLWESC